MLLAVGGACAGSEDVGRALTADKFLWFVLLSFLLRLDAVLQTAEIGALTLIALIVGELVHSPSLQVLVVGISGDIKSRLLINALVLRSLDRLLNNVVFYLFRLNYFSMHYWAVWRLYPLLALSAVKVSEVHTRAGPLFLQGFEKTMHVEDVTTLGHD